MGENFKGLLDKAPDIIRAAAERPLGVVALIVLVLGVVVVLLFRDSAGKLKVLALGMITVGFLGFMALVLVPASTPMPPFIQPQPPLIQPQPGKSSPEKTALGNQAVTKYFDAFDLYLAGQYEQARAAYAEAMAIYKQIDDSDGQAAVLRGLGDLEYKLGRNDQARAAWGKALAHYKQEDNRRGQADVLFGLGALDSRKNPQQAARYFVAAAQLYGMIGMKELHDEALREADELYK